MLPVMCTPLPIGTRVSVPAVVWPLAGASVTLALLREDEVAQAANVALAMATPRIDRRMFMR